MTAKKPSKPPANTIRAPKQKRAPRPLIQSAAKADREINKLRTFQEKLKSNAPESEGDARSSLI